MTYWLQNLFGLLLALGGFFLILFFSSENFKAYPFLVKHHHVIGAVLISLGAAIIAGFKNFIKTIIGLAICLAGICMISFFIDKRDTLMGQVLTNFIGPATILGGCIYMLLFDNDLNSRKKR